MAIADVPKRGKKARTTVSGPARATGDGGPRPVDRERNLATTIRTQYDPARRTAQRELVYLAQIMDVDGIITILDAVDAELDRQDNLPLHLRQRLAVAALRIRQTRQRLNQTLTDEPVTDASTLARMRDAVSTT